MQNQEIRRNMGENKWQKTGYYYQGINMVKRKKDKRLKTHKYT